MTGSLTSRIFATLAAAAVLTTPAASVQAASSAWVKTDHVEARLLSAVAGTGDLSKIAAGIEIKLDDGWKTYWRSPGDAGLPPTLDWTGSHNLSGTTLLYPAPERITVLGIQTFGYKHEVVFPVDLKLDDRGKPVDLKLALDVLICAEQCIPKSLDLALSIPAGPAASDDDVQLLAKARAEVPGDTRASDISVKSVQEVADPTGAPALQVVATSERPFNRPDLIPELVPDAALGPPHISLSADRRDATFILPLARKLPVGAHLAGRRATLTITDGNRALEARSDVTQGATMASETRGPSLLAMIGVALLGGLILNLMPCVLPVLSVKFISVVSQGGRAPAAVRAGFLATAAGIVMSFLAIAGALIAVKSAGRTIGWGIQFQQPAFIAALAVTVTLFACHLVGLFEVPLPRFLANAASSRTGPDGSLAGHFLTGAFATLLATPCSAPFLGTAVGFALAGETIQMLTIFLALGIGLALPYLLVAAVPSLATRLPRPGVWMLRLKQLMAAPLALTAAWLLAVLTSQVGVPAAVMTAALLIAMVGLLFARDRMQATWRKAVIPIIAAVASAAIILPDVLAGELNKGGDTVNDPIAWQRFNRDEIRSLISQGKTVFVDVTADWCLTCQANKKFVLTNKDISDRLNKQTVPMQADWTRPNPQIGAYLAGYGRYGIPFNIIYGPAAPAGIVLPELLTHGEVGAALDRAAGIKAATLSPPAQASP